MIVCTNFFCLSLRDHICILYPFYFPSVTKQLNFWYAHEQKRVGDTNKTLNVYKFWEFWKKMLCHSGASYKQGRYIRYMTRCTVVDRVYKKKAEDTITNITLGSALNSWLAVVSSASRNLAIFLQSAVLSKNLAKNWKTCIWITQKNFNFEKIRWFFLDFFYLFWKVLDDSLWQVHLRGSNILS